MLQEGCRDGNQQILEKLEAADQEDEARTDLGAILVLYVTSSDNQPETNCREEERKRYWRTRSRDASCSLLVDLIPLFAFELFWNTAFAFLVDVETSRADETNQNALLDWSIILLIPVRAVVDAGALVKEKAGNASYACVYTA